MSICENPFFIVCTASSGSTLLSTILDKHPDIAIGPELFFLNKDLVFKEYKNLKKNIQKYLDSGIVTKGQAKTKTFFFNKEAYFLKNKLIIEYISKSNNLKEFCDHLFDNYLIRRNKSIWGEKTGSNGYFLPDILEMYPNAKIIHMVRNPEDVILSIKKRKNTSFDAVSHYIYNSVAALRYKNDSCYLEVRYENFVNDTKSELEKIFSHIGVSNCNNILDKPNDSYWTDVVDNTKNIHSTWSNNPLNGNISTSSIGKGKNQLTELDDYYISKICLSDYSKKILNLDVNKTYDMNYVMKRMGYHYKTNIVESNYRIIFSLMYDYGIRLFKMLYNRKIIIKPLFSYQK